MPSESRRRALAIVHGGAGGGAMHDRFRQVEHALLDRLGDLDVAFTAAPGHATVLAREAATSGEVGLVLAGGGDGTVNEVVNGVLDADGQPIDPELVVGLLAGGTGGDLRKSLGIADMDAALDALTSGQTRTLDVGRLTFASTGSSRDETRLFVNIASFGLSGLVDRHVERFAAAGRFAYVAATARSLWGWDNPWVRLTVDGPDGHLETDTPVVTVAVANGAFFGGGMRVAPEALPDDGALDVVLIGDLRRRDIVGLSGSLYAGTHADHPKVLVRRAHAVTATADVPVFLDVDGEATGQLPARFEVVPGVLRVAVP